MDALGHKKKKPCEEKNIFTPKMESESELKNVSANYKSRIWKFKIQKNILNQKDAEFYV